MAAGCPCRAPPTCHRCARIPMLPCELRVAARTPCLMPEGRSALSLHGVYTCMGVGIHAASLTARTYVRISQRHMHALWV